MMIVCGFITGLSVEITVLLGESIGKKEDKKSTDIIGTGTWIFVILAIVLTVILLTTAYPIAKLLNTPST